MSLTRSTLFSRSLPAMAQRAMYSKGSDPDGSAGAIRSAGGAFAKREAAQEDQYFRNLQAEQLKKLKGHVEEEIMHHQKEIDRHQQAIQRLKQKSKDLAAESK